MNEKKWLLVFLITFFVASLPIVVVNYYIDPLLMYNQKNSLNYLYKGFSERQQKANLISYTDEKFEGILLGSSRSTYINQKDFKNMKIFNYSVSSVWPYEYKSYVDFVKEVHQKDLKYIIIGADFCGTMYPFNVKANPPDDYINNAQSLSYKYKMTFNMSNLKKSLRIVKLNLLNKPFTFRDMIYNRDMIKVEKSVSKEEFIKSYTSNLVRHTYEFTDKVYRWNEDYFKDLRQLKKENPNTKFIIFTSPISADLFVSIIKNAKRSNEYTRWISELVEIFGEVSCFMDINSVTTNLEHYPDDDHYYPYIGKILANKVSTQNFATEPKDFGILVNKSNVEVFLKEQLAKIELYTFSNLYPHEKMEEKLKN